MDEEFKKRLIDRFEGFELAELLDLSVEEVVELFADIIEDNKDFLEEYLQHGR